jgi:hypothetical protein
LSVRFTSSIVPSLSVRCAAVISDGSKISPLAVWCPASAAPYHDATPFSNTGASIAFQCSTGGSALALGVGAVVASVAVDAVDEAVGAVTGCAEGPHATARITQD